jgi:hypothetical protein
LDNIDNVKETVENYAVILGCIFEFCSIYQNVLSNKLNDNVDAVTAVGTPEASHAYLQSTNQYKNKKSKSPTYKRNPKKLDTKNTVEAQDDSILLE